MWFTVSVNPCSIQISSDIELPTLTSIQKRTLSAYVKQRTNSISLAHITKRQQYMGIQLLAGPQALIPRAEIERLGYAVHKLIQYIGERKLTILDICTGSGKLPVVLGVLNPDLMIYASDLSVDAMNLALDNIRLHGLEERVIVKTGDFLEPFLSDKFFNGVDIPVCNPPYYPVQSLKQCQK